MDAANIIKNKTSVYKLNKVAKDLGVSRMTLWNWHYAGRLPFHKIGRMNYITQEDYFNLMGIKEKKEERVVIYVRVSSTVNKENLKTQKERLVGYCIAKGYQIHKVVEEFGSGVNDERPKLQKLLEEQDFTKIVVEHKDRLTRVGFNYIQTLLETQNKEIECVYNADSDEEDIIQDFISIITSYCERIYGKRRSKRKTEKIIRELTNES